MFLPNSFDPETPSLKCMPLGQAQNKMLVTLIPESFVSEGKALWRLNILVSFLWKVESITTEILHVGLFFLAVY